MNGSYHYGHGVNPNQPNPQPTPGAPFPTPGVPGVPGGPGVPGVPGVPYPGYPPMPQQQHNIDGLNYNVPPMAPMNIPERAEHVNNGHHSFSYPPHPIIINQEIFISSTGNRYYTHYNARLPEENHGPVQYSTFVPPSNVIYGQEAPAQREDLFTPLPSEMHPDYRVNANTYGPRPDAVWAPNPGEIFTFGDMLSTLPPPPPPPLAAEVFPPACRPLTIPLIRCDHSSPMESVGARAVGGPVSGPGAPEIPTVSANGPPTAGFPSRLAVGADRLARERPSVTERLAAAANAYEVAGFDDQELEEGLQALERRIDTEFKNAD